MSDEKMLKMRTTVTLENERGRVLELSTDPTGAYIRTPECGVYLPPDALREALERAGVLPPPAWNGVVRIGRGAPLASMSDEAPQKQQAQEPPSGWRTALAEAEVVALSERAERAEKERDAHKANAETLMRDLKEARAAIPNEGWKPVRALTEDEFRTLALQVWDAYEAFDGGVSESVRAMLRWLENEGYLAVRLPPQNQS